MRLVFRLVLSGLLVAGIAAGQSLGEVARKQRAGEQKKTKIYTNDDLPKAGMISVMDPAASTTSPYEKDAAKDNAKADANAPTAPDSADAAKESKDAAKDAKSSGKTGDDEATWRQKFAKAREQLALDQREYDVAQRELNLAQQQYYSDPNEALRQQYDRSDINKRTNNVALLKARVDADQASISSLQDELRKRGLPPGWGRE